MYEEIIVFLFGMNGWLGFSCVCFRSWERGGGCGLVVELIFTLFGMGDLWEKKMGGIEIDKVWCWEKAQGKFFEGIWIHIGIPLRSGPHLGLVEIGFNTT